MTDDTNETVPEAWASPTQEQLDYVSTWFDYGQRPTVELPSQSGQQSDGDSVTSTSLQKLLAVYDCLELMDRVWPRSDGEDTVGLEKIAANKLLADQIASGNVLDSRYRIIAEIGRGGFGVVLKGHDTQLRRDVAIKIALENAPAFDADATLDCGSRTDSEEPVREALKEARVVASLRHPNIVRVLDIGSCPEVPFYIVSELIQGTTLREVARRGRLPLLDTLRVVAKIAAGLDYAHSRGIIHLDVKPANILLDHDGEPHLTDFGMAIRNSAHRPSMLIAGTPHYMAPEQAAGRDHRINRQCDIYSLGVTLYYLLSGKLPYTSSSATELLKLISASRYVPVGQLVEAVPPGLERILDQAMAKRQSDRYQTAAQFAADLNQLADELKLEGADKADASPITIVPQGLRSFSQRDSDFFLQLVPGVRDVYGVPQSLRFWKHRIEQSYVERGTEVNLVFGPSGCGKTSLVKAGLIPLLSKRIVPIYVEASPQNTERDVLMLIRQYVNLPAPVDSLAKAVRWLQSPAMLREQESSDTNAASRFVLFIDQFEQWLHQQHLRENHDLVAALEICDGQNVMPVLMIRDDFWMAASRLMKELDIPIVEGGNAAAVDLFDMEHARHVLRLFGQANGDLPLESGEITADQQEFIRLAIEELQLENRVVCVRIALFAQMMRGRVWSPASLEHSGGSAGIGVRFLGETFGDRTGHANHRAMETSARLVLAALLPEHGTDIKGHRRSAEELQSISGLNADEFQRLLQVLDKELRLITPVEHEAGLAVESTGRLSEADQSGYQLTHDFLVPSIREWLFKKQRETPAGRAELYLAERASLWQAEPLKRYLPSASETIAILRRTNARRWSTVQKAMMASAVRVHSRRAVVALAAVGLMIFGAALFRNRIRSDQFENTAAAKVDSLLTARIGDVPRLIEELGEFRSVADGWLHSRFNAPRNADEQLRAGLALTNTELVEPQFLTDALLNGTPEQVEVIRGIAHRHNRELAPRLWKSLDDDLNTSQRLAAASGLALFAPDDPRWETAARRIADALVRENTLQVASWMEMIRPLSKQLCSPLADVLRNDKEDYSPAQRDIATALLSEYAANDTELILGLLIDAPQFSTLLFDAFARRPDEARRLVKSRLASLSGGQLTGEDKVPEIARRANLIVLAMKLDAYETVWPYWSNSVDHSVRTEVLHALAESSVSPAPLIERAHQEPDPGTRAALLLGIGHLVSDLNEQQATALADLALDRFEHDPAAGVHGACHWLIHNCIGATRSPLSEVQKAEIRDRFDQIETRLAVGKPLGDRNWYVTSHGRHSLTIVPGPTVGWVGSTKDTAPGRDPDEPRRQRQIGRTFAIGQREVTVSQFMEFWQQRPKLREFYDVPDDYFGQVDSQLAVERVNWFLAADFCNWLSEQEGLPKSEWCYPENVDRVNGITIPDDHFERTGYRLLSETEWELSARNGTLTAWHFGSDGQRLNDYAWWQENADERIHPVGLLQPNGLGLFDMIGNAMEWTGTGRQLDEELVDDRLLHPKVNPLGDRVLRGGGYSDFRSYARSAYRESYTPDAGGAELGIRIGRTMPE